MGWGKKKPATPEQVRKGLRDQVAQKRNERERPRPLPDAVGRDLNAIERGRKGGGRW